MGYSFDGETKIITLTVGTVILDVRDLYSRWKDWVLDVGMMYPSAFSVVGGEAVDVAQGIYVTSYFFLENGWKIRPQEATHKLSVRNGILAASDGSDPFLVTLGSYNVMIQYSQPIKSETVATGGGGGGIVTSIQQAALDQITTAGNTVGWDGNKSIPELSADPGAAPTLNQAVLLQYMDLRNERVQGDPTVSGKFYTIYKDNGTPLASGSVRDIAASGIFIKGKLGF
jgi:hypothetical protein